MLTLHSKSPRRTAIPLDLASSFSFTTSDDGDETGTVELVANAATFAESFDAGDACVVYCSRTHRPVWTGSLESIERAPSGAVRLGLVGFGALQREATASVAVNVTSQTVWKPLATWQLSGSPSSRPSDWEVNITENEIFVKTTRTGTYNVTSQIAFAFVYENPPHYRTLTTQERLDIVVYSKTGLMTGINISSTTSTTFPLSPSGYTLVGLNGAITAQPNSISGWIVVTNAIGTETTAGNTTAWFKLTVNEGINVTGSNIGYAFAATGGFCGYIMANVSPGWKRLLSPFASPKDVFRALSGNLDYQKKRFSRSATTPSFVFRGNQQIWRVLDAVSVQNISTTPSRVYGTNTTWFGKFASVPVNVRNVYSRRRMTNRDLNVGGGALNYNNTSQQTQALAPTARVYEQMPSPASIELPNHIDALCTKGGAQVPSWVADVGEQMVLPYPWRIFRIAGRTISKETTRYDLVALDNTLETLARFG